MTKPSTCLDDMPFNCENTGLNTFEKKEAIKYPPVDIQNQLRRGSITKEWNKGLRMPQAKKLTTDTFNGGCTDPWGCVANSGFSCPGSKPKESSVYNMYAFLQKPLDAGTDQERLEYNPPAFMMGIKNGTVNSVNGWKKDGKQYAWEAHNRKDNPAVVEEAKC